MFGTIAHRAKYPAARPLSLPRVLVVTLDHELCSLTARALERSGYESYRCLDRSEFVSLLERFRESPGLPRVDLIVCTEDVLDHETSETVCRMQAGDWVPPIALLERDDRAAPPTSVRIERFVQLRHGAAFPTAEIGRALRRQAAERSQFSATAESRR